MFKQNLKACLSRWCLSAQATWAQGGTNWWLSGVSLWTQREKAHQWWGQDSRRWHWGGSLQSSAGESTVFLGVTKTWASGSLRHGACDVLLQVTCHSHHGGVTPPSCSPSPVRLDLPPLMELSPQFSSVQFSSVVQSCLTLGYPMNRSRPGLPVHHQLLEFTQTHVHWIGDAIQPSHPLSSPSPPALNLSQHQGLFQWVSSSHQVAKVLDFQLQHQSFQWTPRTDLL